MNFKKLKTDLKTNKGMRKHYQDLYKVALDELHFERLQNKFLLSVLEEVETLCNSKVKHELIKKVVENAADIIFK